jgi:uncharacterized protein
MPESLPELLDPRRAVALGSCFEGHMAIARLSRLRPLLASAEGSVDYRLRFGKDERGYGTVTGRVSGELRLYCQRCNEEMLLPVDSEISLALTEGLDEAAALPDDFDPLLLDGRLMRSSELIEDELLLAVPVVPRHPEGSCEAPLPKPASAKRDAQAECVGGGRPQAPGQRLSPQGGAKAHPEPEADPERQRESQPASQTESERPNPFAALAALRRDRNK